MRITSVELTLRDIADFIRNDEVLSNVPGLEVHIEDKSDISSEVEKFLKGFGVMVVLTVLGHTRRQCSGDVMTGSLNLTISTIEATKHNRMQSGYMTATDVAIRLSEILHFREFYLLSSPLRYVSMTRADTDRGNSIMSSSYVAESKLFTLDELNNQNETTQEGE